MKKILLTIIQKQFFILTIAAILVCGYLAYQISVISALAPDPSALATEREKAQASVIRFDAQTIKLIQQQNQVNVQPDTNNLGKFNPFY